MILAHRRPVNPRSGVADDLLAPTELVSIDDGRVTTLLRPKAGRSLQRPVRHADGRLCWVDLPAVIHPPFQIFGIPAPRGSSTDLDADAATVVVDEKPLAPPVRQLTGGRTERWAAVGHPEWTPDGRLVLAAKVEERLDWWPLPLAASWRTFVVDPDDGRAQVLREGWAEPSWHTHWGIAYARVDGRTVEVPGLSAAFDVPGQQAFDPFLSPDGSRVVVLVRGKRWGLWVHRVRDRTGEWLVSPEDRAVEVSHARWIDDGSVVAACKTDSPWHWSLWRLGLNGSRDRLTTAADGSVEQPFPTR